MKDRLNITVEETLLHAAKRYAERNSTSLSQLVAEYFKTLTYSPKKANTADLIESLPKPKISIEGDIKKGYYAEVKRSMASKVFIDATFTIDFTLQGSGYASSKAVFQLAYEGKIELYTSTLVLPITNHYLIEAYGLKQAKKIVMTPLNDVRLIDCSHTIALMAINSAFEDVDDALQYYTALSHGAIAFLSLNRNFKKKALPQLPVLPPEEFVKNWEI